MAEYIIDERDVKFVLYEMLDVAQLTKSEKFGGFGKEDFDMVLESAWKLARTTLSAANADGDEHGAHLVDGVVKMPKSHHAAYKAYREGGWGATTADPEFGGQGLPYSVGIAVAEAFVGAACAFAMTPGLTNGAAGLIHSFGTPEQKALYLEKMWSGQWAGTMCLTEPSAGSAVGDLMSKAKPCGDGTYKITGTKIFISSGDQDFTENIIHLFLAKIDAPDTPKGIKGVSLFVVPKVRVNPDGGLGKSNDVVCTKIEEKMGIHGSSTAVLNFGDNGECIGYLLGEAHQGIKYMFQMMNEARIGVGVQGQSMCAGAYELARKYAKERVQGVDVRNMKDADAPRVEIVQHPDVRRMLLYQKAIAEGTRALIYSTAFYEDMSQVAPDENDRMMYHHFVELLTPICKAYSTDMGYLAATSSVQTLGGYGYCREYGVEQYVRDLKIGSIYEGTNGIQALDLVGRKLGMGGGMVLMSYLNALNSWVDAHKEDKGLAPLVQKLDAAKGKLIEVTMAFQMEGRSNPMFPVANASTYLEMFGHVQIAYLLLQQAVIADKKFAEIAKAKGVTDEAGWKKLVETHDEARYYSNKICTAAFFVNQVLPHALADAEIIMAKDRSIFDVVF
jgi:alkylation response protein AidB-like acyl-CoA dehydrogenase